MIDETRELNAVSCLTVALALAELIELHGAQVGPQEATDPPAFVQRDHQLDARAALDRLYSRAAELNPYRGRAVRASMKQGWQEIDLGICAVRDQHEMLNRHGLGSRRGVLLVGPPGTGKSAVSAVIAAELVDGIPGDVDAHAVATRDPRPGRHQRQ
ncbi:ATP-binding protein [Gordonia jinhuaensis]|uniref:hypothetical protein n=1 Tax=Gordonia jinhuaensis TaxID=1517702 RepID=UPI0016654DED|nr:hypothetical protein [Gordonia jinhuaensis]